MLTRLSRGLTRPRSSWLVLLIALLIGGAVLTTMRGAEVVNDHGAPPPASESARVTDLTSQLPDDGVESLVVVLTRPEGGELDHRDFPAVQEAAAQLPVAPGHEVAGPIPSENNEAALLQVPVEVDIEDSDALRATVDEVRGVLDAELPGSLRAQTTGGPAFAADISASFDGANFRLLAITIGFVALLLLLTYRSPILWLIPISVVAFADQVFAMLTGQLGERLELNFDAGIISVLVFGAGTNYALLLISRYREELRRHEDHRVALRTAWRASLPTILGSNLSVVLALAALVLAVIPGTRGVGIAAAVGLIVAVVFAIFVLPPALAVVGRGALWPFIPRPGQQHETGGGLWGRVAAGVVRRPWQVLVAGLALLGIMATGLISTQVGLTQAERFRVQSESGEALSTISANFPAGFASPMTVVSDADHAEEVAATAENLPGIAQVTPVETGRTDLGQTTVLTVVGEHAPGSAEERALVSDLRAAVHDIDGAQALVGGEPAADLDSRAGAERDLWLVAPLILLVVALTLAILLRSLLAPVVLLSINILSTLATIGAGAWLGREFFGFHSLDTPVPLLAFLFLVALGIDYTIFLAYRVRSEARYTGTASAVIIGVRTTGVVITSAGLVLAGVFAALAVLPLVTLGQLGLIVGLGVVVDTMVVRTLLVPAVMTLLGERFWWPSTPAQEGRRSPETASTAV